MGFIQLSLDAWWRKLLLPLNRNVPVGEHGTHTHREGEAMNDRWMRRVLVATVTGAFLATSATAMFVPANKDLLKCEAGTSKALAKFAGGKQKCITKCQAAARKG